MAGSVRRGHLKIMIEALAGSVVFDHCYSTANDGPVLHFNVILGHY